MPGGYRALSFQHVTALTLVVTLAATSAVSLSDVLFVLLSLPYLRLLSALTFPPPPIPPPPVFSPQEKRYLAIYVSVGGLVGLLLPLLHMLYCLLVVKDIDSIHASAPHLFLLSAQIFLEGVSFGYDFSLPSRAAVPIIYNTKRLFTIAAWVQRVVGGGFGVGVVIALANAAFWGFNLLGFLLPVYLPRALKLYYCSEASDNKSS